MSSIVILGIGTSHSFCDGNDAGTPVSAAARRNGHHKSLNTGLDHFTL
jgi:hypothetical protein